MKLKQKAHIKDIDKGRFFFTAEEELGEWLKNGAKDLGVKVPVFIIMNLHRAMKESQPL